jgi:hypothetical protein
MKARLADVIADGACIGSGGIAVLNAADWAARRGVGDVTAVEVIRLKVLAASLGALFIPVRGISAATAAIIAIVVALGVWSATRRAVATLIVAIAAAWVAAMSGIAAYMLDPATGLWSAALALVPALYLATRGRSNTAALIVLALGFGLSFFVAQNLLIATPEATGGINPMSGFAPVALLSGGLAWWIGRRKPDPPMRFGRRFLRVWGLAAVCFSLATPVAVEALWSRRSAPDPPAARITDGFAYDVRVVGNPPSAIWTNRRQAEVLEDPYADVHRRYKLDEHAGFSERIWGDPKGGFYLQEGRTIARWAPLQDHQPIPAQPTETYNVADWTPAGFIEDPRGHQTLLLSEWLSQYAVIDRAADRVIARGAFSDAAFPFPFTTLDPATRTVFISTWMDDGRLYEFDLASGSVARSAPNLFLYATVLDPAAGLLWGVRPFTGEVVGVDTRSFAIRHRVFVEPALRDIDRDEQTGDLYTCSILYGDVFRVDPRALTAAKIGWCGRQCRNLFVDSPRRTLWIATADGVCRLPLSASGAPVPG